MPTQYASRVSPRSYIPTMSHLPHGISRPNLRQPMATAPPAFMTTFQPVDRPSDSRGKYSGHKTGKDKT